MLTQNFRSPRLRAVLALAAGVAGALFTSPAALAVTPTFGPAVPYAGATDVDDVAFADITGDGRGDLLTLDDPVGFQEPGLPAVVATRTITIKE